MPPREVFTLPTPAEATNFVLARSGNLAAAACADRKLRIWALPEARLLRAIDLAGGYVYVAAISDDGRWILTGDHQGDINIWASATGESHMHFRLSPYHSAGAFSHDGGLLALAAAGETGAALRCGGAPQAGRTGASGGRHERHRVLARRQAPGHRGWRHGGPHLRSRGWQTACRQLRLSE